MTIETELLPLPKGYDKYSPPRLYDGQMFHEGQMRAYALANSAMARAPLQAEIEALRAEVERLRADLAEPAGGGRMNTPNEYHPCTQILIDGLRAAGAHGVKVLSEWDRAREIVDRKGYTSGPRCEAEARAEQLEKALKDIRSLSSINSAMNPSPLALTVLLGDIHHIADAVLAKEKGND